MKTPSYKELIGMFVFRGQVHQIQDKLQTTIVKNSNIISFVLQIMQLRTPLEDAHEPYCEF